MKYRFFTSLILGLLILFTSLLSIPTLSQESCYQAEHRISAYNGYTIDKGTVFLYVSMEFFNPNTVDVSFIKHGRHQPNGDLELNVNFADPEKFNRTDITFILNTISKGTLSPGISGPYSQTIKFEFQGRNGADVNDIPDGEYTINYRFSTIFAFPLILTFLSGEPTYEIPEPDWESTGYASVTKLNDENGQECKFSSQNSSSTRDGASQNYAFIFIILATSIFCVYFLRKVKIKPENK